MATPALFLAEAKGIMAIIRHFGTPILDSSPENTVIRSSSRNKLAFFKNIRVLQFDEIKRKNDPHISHEVSGSHNPLLGI